MDIAPHRRTAGEINTRLRNMSDHPFRNRAPDHYGRLISSLVHLVHGDEVRYVGARFDDDERAGEIVMFTDRLAIRATITGGETDWQGGGFTTEAVGRRSLTSASVESDHSVFDGTMTAWPGRYSVTLTYPGFTVTLPMRPYPGDQEQDALNELVPTLRADLAAP